MKKLIKHRWQPQNGFRIHKCVHCGIIRYWDEGYQRIMYKWFDNGVPRITYKPPECKRIYLSDKIDLSDIGEGYNNGDFYKR